MEKIIIYTQSNCRQSDKLKQALNSKKICFTEKDISYDVLSKREMIERSGGRSITPQVFFEGKHIIENDKFLKQLLFDEKIIKVA